MSAYEQSNTQQGDIVLPSGEDLSESNGYLAKITHDSGEAELKLPDDNSDHAYYLILDGGEDEKNTSVRPLEGGRQTRIKAKGTGNPGDVLVLADTAVSADKGKVRALPSTAGTYRGLAIAEESFVDEQLVKCRPANIGNITVSE